MSYILETLWLYAPGWLLVLIRIAGIFLFAPVLGSKAVLVRVKVMLAVGLAACVYPVLIGSNGPNRDILLPVWEAGQSLWTLAAMVAGELLVGAAIGFGASLPMIGVQMGAQVADQQMGLGLAGVLNPELDEQMGIISELYFTLAATLFVILGGHRVMLSVLIGSFAHVPIGAMAVDAPLLELLVGILAVVVELAMRVSGPLLCLVMLETVTMGLVARTVPQINIFSIGLPMRILLCLGFLLAASGVVVRVYATALSDILQQITEFFCPQAIW